MAEINKIDFSKHDRFIALRVGVLEVLAFDTLECVKDSLQQKRKKLDKITKKNKYDFGLQAHVDKLDKMEFQTKMMYHQLEKLLQYYEDNMSKAQYTTLVNCSKQTLNLIEGKRI